MLQTTVDYLNELLEIDPTSIQTLIDTRVPCNAEMANHETVQVALADDNKFTLGPLGLLNGLLGRDGQVIVACYQQGILIKFSQLEIHHG